MNYLQAIAATFITSLASLFGVFVINLKRQKIKNYIRLMIAFAAGAMLSNVLFHLIPESLEIVNFQFIAFWSLLAFFLFYLLEKYVHWRHCHQENCKLHSFGYMSLFGDALHNLLDGVLIATSFMVNLRLGYLTTISIIFHELPQEIGDYAILLKAGFSAKKALFFNFLSALTAFLGLLIGFILNQYFHQQILPYFLSLTIGGFLYISLVDLLPQMHRQANSKLLWQILFFFFGLIFLLLL